MIYTVDNFTFIKREKLFTALLLSSYLSNAHKWLICFEIVDHWLPDPSSLDSGNMLNCSLFFLIISHFIIRRDSEKEFGHLPKSAHLLTSLSPVRENDESTKENVTSLHNGSRMTRRSTRILQYWAICSSARSLARTAHSFTCSALLALLTSSATLIRSLAPALTRKKGFCVGIECVKFKFFQPSVRWNPIIDKDDEKNTMTRKNGLEWLLFWIYTRVRAINKSAKWNNQETSVDKEERQWINPRLKLTQTGELAAF